MEIKPLYEKQKKDNRENRSRAKIIDGNAAETREEFRSRNSNNDARNGYYKSTFLSTVAAQTSVFVWAQEI